ncbi:kinase-like protein [Ceratobasidium sp. AG-I]|nr:kinase-like protein [Ceratobasidium sp. AG-I]
MHELRPAPIAHGDIKSHNILVTENEKAIICDFGRSRSPQDQPQEVSRSSPFGATLRYMSPELFASSMAGPTPASDMWAYGCVALEVGPGAQV